MESRYDAESAAALAESLQSGEPRVSEALALRTYTSRLVGSDPALVLHGGGNTSVKDSAQTVLGETVDVLCIKGSGWDLATMEPQGHPAVRLEALRAMRKLDRLSDEAMVAAIRSNLLDPAAPNPSIETLLHAWIPARFVDHTHADAILALADQPDGRKIFTQLFGKGLVWVPYVMPGFALAKRCAQAFDEVAAQGQPELIVLEKHGLITWGETAEESSARDTAAIVRS